MSLECDGVVTELKQGVTDTEVQVACRVVSCEDLLAGDNGPIRKPATEKNQSQRRKTLSIRQTKKAGKQEGPLLAGLALSGTSLSLNSKT